MSATVLLLEDDAPLLDLLCLAIESWGHRVLSAAEAPEALRLAGTEGSVDLVVADLGLLERASSDVLEQIRAAHPGVPCIYMSGYRSAAADAIGEEPFLLKPFPLEALEDALRDALATP